jgi:hypothetical protein
VAGVAVSLEEDRPEGLDDSFPLLPWTRHAGTEFRPGSGHPAPISPVSRKGSSTLDVVFYTDPAALRLSASAQSVSCDIVNLYHPCCKRLFRPPRPVPC